MSAPQDYRFSEGWAAVSQWRQQDPTVALLRTENFKELEQQLAQARQEKRNIEKYTKTKERQVIELGERLEEKKRENEHLTTEITVIRKQMKKVTLELSETTENLASTLNTAMPELSNENDQLKREITSLKDDLTAARAQITWYEEDYRKEVESNRSWFKIDFTSRESGKSKQSTAAAQSAEEEEKQRILTAQVNAYSRECDKLKKQLATANEETDSLRKEVSLLTPNNDTYFLKLEQSYSHANAHISKLQSDLDTERRKNEKSTRANETLQKKVKELEEIVHQVLDQRSVHSAPVQYTGMTQQPQQANDSSAGQYVANVKRHIEETPQMRPQARLDTTLQLLEEDSERKRREADRALQEIEETRRDLEQQNQKVNFSNTYPQPLKQEHTVATRKTVSDSISQTTAVETNQHFGSKSELAAGVTSTSLADDPDSDDVPENKLIEGIDQEIQYYADQVRQMSRRPDTAEVEASISELPYDPNLVCPKCGKRYRIGGVQKFRRHVKEKCTGNR